MLLREKKAIYNLFNTLVEIMDRSATNSNDHDEALDDCLEAINLILEYLNNQEEVAEKTIKQLNNIIKDITKLKGKYNLSKNIKRLIDEISLAENIFKHEVQEKIKVLFLPYKFSMWDSLETIYYAALNDPNCDVNVVPIPYYEFDTNTKKDCYEGDLFPKEIEITHYNDYDIEKEKPDIIFVHNIYDQYNTLTQVYEEYFTSNLRKYTDMLVFVPYHISSFVDTGKNAYLAYNTPSIVNVDKVILAGEHVKRAAIRDGIPEDKLLVLGSPKFDKIINSMKDGVKYPDVWLDRIEGKIVFTLNTGCLFFAKKPFYKVGLLTDILNIPNFIENSVLIWRPHPLTKASIKRYTPELLDYYELLTNEYIPNEYRYKNIILDETDDYIPSLMAADVLISASGSLLRSYLVTKKKVMYLHKEIAKSEKFFDSSHNPSDAFYYFYDNKDHWSEVVKKLAQGIDPLEEKRKHMFKRTYVNTDGSAGEKIYNSIKEIILS